MSDPRADTLPKPELVAEPAVPRTFGRYELRRELGRGGAGMVWEAWDPVLERAVALKTLIAGRWAGPDQRARFLREVRATAALRHPNIISVHDAGEVEGIAYLAMDLVDGRPLDALIVAEGGALAPRRAVELLLPIARALEHAHQHGIVHRDVKPENVLVDAGGAPFLSDFGLARDIGEERRLTHSGQAIGTPAFMAPEQLSGRSVDGRTDVYALGATLYECLAGEVPFPGQVWPELVARVLRDDPPPLRRRSPRVAPDLEAIVLRCLEKDPARRYPSAAALAGELERFLRGEAVEARTPSRLRWLVRRARGHWQLVIGLAVAVTGVLGGVSHAALVRGELAAHERVRGALDKDRERILAQRAEAIRRFEREESRRLALADAALAPSQQDALLAYDRVLEREPDLWEARLSRARLLDQIAGELRARDRDPEGALAAWERAVVDLRGAADLATTKGPFLLLLAETLRTDLCDPVRAAEALRALEDEGADGLSDYASARLLQAAGRHAEAQDALRAALAARPDLAPARVLRAELLLAAGQATAALEELDLIAAHLAGDPEVLRLRAEALLGLGNVDDAVRDAARAAELAPRDWQAQLVLGRARLRSADPRGLATLERARRLAPDEPEVTLALGWAFLARGDRKTAAWHLVQAGGAGLRGMLLAHAIARRAR